MVKLDKQKKKAEREVKRAEKRKLNIGAVKGSKN